MRQLIEHLRIPSALSTVKFVRVERAIFVPDQTARRDIEHRALLLDSQKELLRLLSEDPAELDAGYIRFASWIQDIGVDGSSKTLDLPVPAYAVLARQKTSDRLVEIFPGHTINDRKKGRIILNDALSYEEGQQYF